MEFTQLFPELKLVEDRSLREKTEKTWLLGMARGGWGFEDLSSIPFTLLIPGTSIDLITHTRAVTACGLKICESLRASYPGIEINTDHLIVGGLLHDVGKLLEYERSGTGYRKSRKGSLLRHPVSGATLAGECGLPPEIVHIIYTHSKEGDRYERSVESIIINHSDFVNFEPLKVIANG